MQGSRTLGFSQSVVWKALNEPSILKRCIPGCDKFEFVSENQYAVGVAIKIGPVSAKFSGTVVLKDVRPPDSYELQFDAQGGVVGFGKGECKVALETLENGCQLSYTVHSRIGGKLAQMGQRLIDGVAKSITEDFFRRFEEALLKDAADDLENAYFLQDGTQPASLEMKTNSSRSYWSWAIAAAVVLSGFYFLK